MKIYIDLFFIFNTVIDIITIMGVSYILKRKTNIIRIVIAGIIGGVSSLFLFTSINKIIIELISIIVMTILAFSFNNFRYMLKNILYMYLISVLFGGLLYLFNIKVDNSLLYYVVVIIIAIEVTVLYVKEMNKLKNNYNNYYKVNIVFGSHNLSLIGFVDTGNNLYDPYKHRPIILLNKKYEGGDNYLLVPYNTALGSGLLKCIKPKCVTVDGSIIKNVLIGFSDSVKLIDGVDVILHNKIMKGK